MTLSMPFLLFGSLRRASMLPAPRQYKICEGTNAICEGRVGDGFTAGSDRLVAKTFWEVAKTFWEYDFPVPGKSGDEKADKPMKPPPKMRMSARPPTSTTEILTQADPFSRMR
jgi:hypothetical protein